MMQANVNFHIAGFCLQQYLVLKVNIVTCLVYILLTSPWSTRNEVVVIVPKKKFLNLIIYYGENGKIFLNNCFQYSTSETRDIDYDNCLVLTADVPPSSMLKCVSLLGISGREQCPDYTAF
jgi:hypothetical protein